MSPKYVYGIIRDSDRACFGEIGIPTGREVVYTIGNGPIAAVVSDYRGPQMAELTRQELMRQLVLHQTVIETVMRDRTILPAKFGTLLHCALSVRKALRCGLDEMELALEKYGGLIQYEVAVTWDLQQVFNEIAVEPEIAKLRACAAALSFDESLGIRTSIGALVKESLDCRRDDVGKQIALSLEKCSLELHANPLMGDEMVLNVACLVSRDGREALFAQLQHIDAKFGGRLDLRCVGPLPAYSFATVEIVSPDLGEIDSALRLLGLSGQISESIVRKAYREQASRLHPDVNRSPEANDRFLQLQSAQRLLGAYCVARASRDGREKDIAIPSGRDIVPPAYLVTVKGIVA